MNCQCVNTVQSDGNAVFSHLATPGSFKAHPGKLQTLEKDYRGDRDFILDPYARIPEVKGLNEVCGDDLVLKPLTDFNVCIVLLSSGDEVSINKLTSFCNAISGSCHNISQFRHEHQKCQVLQFSCHCLIHL